MHRQEGMDIHSVWGPYRKDLREEKLVHRRLEQRT